MRTVDKVICSCGGEYEEVPTNESERVLHGCYRDSETISCCVAAYICNKCANRATVVFNSPDID